MNKLLLLEYLLNDCGLFAFPIHSIDNTGACSCKKGMACTGPGKHPYLNLKWKNIATNSIGKLQSWANKREINYAICTGRFSERTKKYLVVVDIDTQEHDILKTLPETFHYKTGSGGYHYWFWSPQEIKNSVSQLADKVDIRGTGGYVIIPPSKHVSGQEYTLLCDETQEITDLPENLLKTLLDRQNYTYNLSKPSSSKTKAFSRTSDVKLPAVILTEDSTYKWWSKTPVPELRQGLNTGKKIPLGVRNIVVHRLLSSDRAKGLATYEDLIAKAGSYRESMENPATFDDRELRNIVCSVMRYPVYNNEVENVNKNYAKWMAKTRKQEINPDGLELLDKEFFSGLGENNSKGIPLNFLAQVRKEWYHARGMKDGFATYRPQLLAKKLKQLGFVRVRSASQNLWNVDINQLEFGKQEKQQMTTHNVLAMADEVSSPEELPTEESTEETTNGNAPIGPDGNPLTLVEEREEVIETKAKYHPNDFKYVGRDGSQEQMMELVRLFETLSEEQIEDYSNGKLLVDEERTRTWMSALEKGDVIGLNSQMYKIDAIYEDEISCCPREISRYKREAHFDTIPEQFTIYDIDRALSTAHGEILYRNNKPFGVEEEMSYKVKVMVYADHLGRTYVFRKGHRVSSSESDKTKNES